MELICTTFPWSCGPIGWAIAIGAVLTLLTGILAGFGRIFHWLVAPVRWVRRRTTDRRKHEDFMREHERVVRENNELNGRNAVLEEQLQTLENRLQEREKWTRFTTKGGGVVLVEKIHTDPTQAGAIYACVYCFEDRKIFPLQPVSARRFLHCPTHGNVNFESDGSMKISAQALEKAGGNLGPHGWMAR